MVKVAEREEARRLRLEERMSLPEISKKTGRSKGTLSLWLRDIPLSTEERRAKELVGIYKSHETRRQASAKPKERVYHDWSSEEQRFRNAAMSSVSFIQMKKMLGLQPTGTNVTIKFWVEKFGIDISHFTGQLWSKGRKLPEYSIPLEKFVSTLAYGKNENTSRMKARLIRFGYKEALCEMCNLAEWNGYPAPLELHHIDGDRLNNALDNLQILCSNCHAQTDTYCGKNKKLKNDHNNAPA